MTLGLATLPRQLALLEWALAPTGQPGPDHHLAMLHDGLVRLIVADRLMPPPTVLVAAALVALIADSLLGLGLVARHRVWAVAVLGTLPLAVQRLGELAVTYLLPIPSRPSPGDVIALPRQFATGLRLLWPVPAPLWVASVDARANLITLSCVAVWALGLRRLDGGRWSSWHLVLPAGCLAVAGWSSWLLEPVVTAALLGAP